MPANLQGRLDTPDNLTRYARSFLQRLAQQGVQVAGLTPHSPRAGNGPDTSATWRIVEEWNDGVDDDGVAFREKIFAIFPGFEPSFRDGKQGLHLIILFDPEIGRERYLRAFDVVMGGVSPWKNGKLRMADKRPEQAFEDLRKFKRQECPHGCGDYLVLAPHIDANNGLLGAQKAQVLEMFSHEEVAGLELGDRKSPTDTLANRPWLRKGMEAHRQSFFHASDAYCLEEIGRRYTWLKLATPRVEALRQAFVSSDSRVRLAFKAGRGNTFLEDENPPDVLKNSRPWIREIVVRGGASFFGGNEEGRIRETRFRFNPDLTCIIGGSMTGKSTLLDGLRIHAAAPLPDDETVRANVEARARVFSAGRPEIATDCPGQDSSVNLGKHWPAQFFSQNELQRLSQDVGAIQEILAKLVPAESREIEDSASRLERFDHELIELAKELDKLDDQLAEVEQAQQRANDARNALTSLSEAGIECLHRITQERQTWEAAHWSANLVRNAVQSAVVQFAEMSVFPRIDMEIKDLGNSGSSDLRLVERWERIVENLQVAVQETDAWIADARIVAEKLSKIEQTRRVEVELSLYSQGFGAAKLSEFDKLNRQASLLPNYEAALKLTRAEWSAASDKFNALRNRRRILIKQHREAFDRVIHSIRTNFGDRIRVVRINEGNVKPVEQFLQRLKQRGITRWWNDLTESNRPSSETLLVHFDDGSLQELGMSDPVQKTIRESLTRSVRRQLETLRCPDLYRLELKVDDDSYRTLEELSGGQRVSVLLSLLLETTDERPLVIDQPEDELDNRFLFDTVLQALKELKGRRQVIIATHNANVVVNGDADMIIQLDASAHQGKVACAGAIEEPEIRNAIVRTVDGGEAAFRLRRRKYGF